VLLAAIKCIAGVALSTLARRAVFSNTRPRAQRQGASRKGPKLAHLAQKPTSHVFGGFGACHLVYVSYLTCAYRLSTKFFRHSPRVFTCAGTRSAIAGRLTMSQDYAFSRLFLHRKVANLCISPADR